MVLRLPLGIVFFLHGMQKLLGWFSGNGFVGTMGFFTGKLGIPAEFAFLAIIAEGFGSLSLIAGFLARVAALGISATITAAASMLHVQNGFFMNWFGGRKGEGVEYHIVVAAIGLGLMIRVGGM
ncbi:MAG TPA: DoxX family protein [Nitrospirota bacterium]|nr:DoxX family protein [Nitrospirota bacterium]